MSTWCSRTGRGWSSVGPTSPSSFDTRSRRPHGRSCVLSQRPGGPGLWHRAHPELPRGAGSTSSESNTTSAGSIRRSGYRRGPFKFMLIPVSHSVPRGLRGGVRHPGRDGRCTPATSSSIRLRSTSSADLPALASLGRRGVRLLLSDSTNAERGVRALGELRRIADIIRDARGRGDRSLLLVPTSTACNRSLTQELQLAGRSRSSGVRCIATLRSRRPRHPRCAGQLGRGHQRPHGSARRSATADHDGSQGEPFAALH